jgi:hypothetical protein
MSTLADPPLVAQPLTRRQTQYAPAQEGSYQTAQLSVATLRRFAKARRPAGSVFLLGAVGFIAVIIGAVFLGIAALLRDLATPQSRLKSSAPRTDVRPSIAGRLSAAHISGRLREKR